MKKKIKQIVATQYQDFTIYAVVTEDGELYWLEKDNNTGKEYWTLVNTPEHT